MLFFFPPRGPLDRGSTVPRLCSISPLHTFYNTGHWAWGENMRFFEAFWVTTFGLLSMMILALISFEQYSRFVKQKQLLSWQVSSSNFILSLIFLYDLTFHARTRFLNFLFIENFQNCYQTNYACHNLFNNFKTT